MNSIHGLVLRVAALVIGSAIVGAGIASNPATAQDVNSMLKAFSTTTCSTSGACKQFKNTGSGAAVKGVAGSGNGVIAQSTSGSATFSTSTNGDGLQSYSNNNDGTNSGTNNNSTTHPAHSGVWGHDDSTDGGTKNVGVAGSSNNGTGVSGSSTNNTGVQGVSSNFYGVYGFSSTRSGGFFESASTDDFAFAVLSDAAGGDPFIAESQGGFVYEDASGNLNATGGMFATSFNVVTDEITNDGRHVSAYASQSADAEMSDVGTGHIAGGHGIVQLDSAFARTLDMKSGYHVFLTPMGDCKGLYIASKSPSSFEVRELQGGQSSISFDYRIIGRAAGIKTGRLPAVRLLAPRIIRGRALSGVPAH